MVDVLYTLVCRKSWFIQLPDLFDPISYASTKANIQFPYNMHK